MGQSLSIKASGIYLFKMKNIAHLVNIKGSKFLYRWKMEAEKWWLSRRCQSLNFSVRWSNILSLHKKCSYHRIQHIVSKKGQSSSQVEVFPFLKFHSILADFLTSKEKNGGGGVEDEPWNMRRVSEVNAMV